MKNTRRRHVNGLNITETESVIMEALWARSPLTAEQIALELAGPDGLTTATTKSLTTRLLKKGAVSATADGRRYLYRPAVGRADYIAAESKLLVDRLFGGRLTSLIRHLSQVGGLAPEDIDDLKRLFQELDQGRPDSQTSVARQTL